MTFKFKFRVFVEKYCRGCKEIHVQATHRYVFRQVEGTDVDEARHRSWLWCVGMLEQENRAADKKKQNLHQRPLWQRDIEVA
jgi:hypothetical protein